MNPSINSIKALLKTLGAKKTKDYTFLSIFFVVFSIFILFAIRPSLTTAFSLKRQEEELRGIDQQYEQIITRIIRVQNSLETVRDRLYLVDQALPEQPKLNIIIRDIQESAQASNISIQKININKINLVEAEKDIFRSMVINLEASASFPDLLKFENEMIQQRRLKRIKNLSVERDELVGSNSASLKIIMEIEGFYL